MFLSGTTSSALTCAVLLRTHLRKKFYSHFLVGESVSSLGFLLTVLINWMHDQGLAVFRVPGLCQVNVFCSHFFLCLVIWLSVISALLILFDLARPSPVRWMNSPGVSKVWVLGEQPLCY
ncbi:neuropeptide GPCR A19 [Elysia marginata]|uniref:Neuropeptide GPCR A19 n=1 Tax=Elysia marginata TaxID=1093978 RepID=A0AAV4FTM8_9GAST|nr:neuropeptide GPCR A19 [Elysia marginata]